jgi:hypothetical protein
MTEFMLSLEDFAAFKNGLDQYYNEVAVDDKTTFLKFLMRLQENTVGLQQECCGEIFTFCQIHISEIDLQRAVSALSFVCLMRPSEKEIVSTKEVLDRINEVYKTA